MSLIGDKEMSDPESLSLSDGEEDTTSKESEPGAISTGSDTQQTCNDSDQTPTPNFFEDIDNFEVGDADIGDIGVISTNNVIQGALEGFFSIKKSRKDLIGRIENKV